MTKKPKPRIVKDTPRLLSASGSGYVADAKYSLGQSSRHPTPFENLIAGEDPNDIPEPEGVDTETQKWISEEAKNRYKILHAEENRRQVMKSRLSAIRQECIRLTRENQDPTDVLDSALEALRKRRAA